MESASPTMSYQKPDPRYQKKWMSNADISEIIQNMEMSPETLATARKFIADGVIQADEATEFQEFLMRFQLPSEDIPDFSEEVLLGLSGTPEDWQSVPEEGESNGNGGQGVTEEVGHGNNKNMGNVLCSENQPRAFANQNNTGNEANGLNNNAAMITQNMANGNPAMAPSIPNAAEQNGPSTSPQAEEVIVVKREATTPPRNDTPPPAAPLPRGLIHPPTFIILPEPPPTPVNTTPATRKNIIQPSKITIPPPRATIPTISPSWGAISTSASRVSIPQPRDVLSSAPSRVLIPSRNLIPPSKDAFPHPPPPEMTFSSGNSSQQGQMLTSSSGILVRNNDMTMMPSYTVHHRLQQQQQQQQLQPRQEVYQPRPLSLREEVFQRQQMPIRPEVYQPRQSSLRQEVFQRQQMPLRQEQPYQNKMLQAKYYNVHNPPQQGHPGYQHPIIPQAKNEPPRLIQFFPHTLTCDGRNLPSGSIYTLSPSSSTGPVGSLTLPPGSRLVQNGPFPISAIGSRMVPATTTTNSAITYHGPPQGGMQYLNQIPSTYVNTGPATVTSGMPSGAVNFQSKGHHAQMTPFYTGSQSAFSSGNFVPLPNNTARPLQPGPAMGHQGHGPTGQQCPRYPLRLSPFITAAQATERVGAIGLEATQREIDNFAAIIYAKKQMDESFQRGKIMYHGHHGVPEYRDNRMIPATQFQPQGRYLPYPVVTTGAPSRGHHVMMNGNVTQSQWAQQPSFGNNNASRSHLPGHQGAPIPSFYNNTYHPPPGNGKF